MNRPLATMPKDKSLRIELAAPAMVRYTLYGWRTFRDVETMDMGLGLHLIDVDPVPSARLVEFTFRWSGQRWEGRNYSVVLTERYARPALRQGGIGAKRRSMR